MLPLNQVICGDNVAVLSGFPDACIDLVVTSPPYDNLRTYFSCNYVVLKSNLSHERKLRVISEIAQRGIKPASQRRMVAPEISSRGAIILSDSENRETEPKKCLRPIEAIRDSNKNEGTDNRAEQLVEAGEAERGQGQNSLIRGKSEDQGGGNRAPRIEGCCKSNVRKGGAIMSKLEGWGNSRETGTIQHGQMEGVYQEGIYARQLQVSEVSGEAVCGNASPRPSYTMLGGLSGVKGGIVEHDNSLCRLSSLGSQQSEYEYGIYRGDDIPNHLKRSFECHQVEWDFPALAAQLTRVLKPGGVIVWVVADATVGGSETLSSMRQAIHFKDVCGLNVHDTMIYAANKPPLTHNRYEQSWEYMFVLSKGRPSRWNPLKQTCAVAGRKTSRRGAKGDNGQSVRERDGFTTVSDTKTRPNVWDYVLGHGSGLVSGNHPAPFPLALASDHILSWSNPGDVVLDPFNGSGTTCKAAKELNRHFIGIEISPAYCQIANTRLQQEVLQLESP